MFSGSKQGEGVDGVPKGQRGQGVKRSEWEWIIHKYSSIKALTHQDTRPITDYNHH